MTQTFQASKQGRESVAKITPNALKPLADLGALRMLHDAFSKFMACDLLPYPASMVQAKKILLSVPYSGAHLGAFSKDLAAYAQEPGFKERAEIFFGVAASESLDVEIQLFLHSYGIESISPRPSSDKSVSID